MKGEAPDIQKLKGVFSLVLLKLKSDVLYMENNFFNTVKQLCYRSAIISFNNNFAMDLHENRI